MSIELEVVGRNVGEGVEVDERTVREGVEEGTEVELSVGLTVVADEVEVGAGVDEVGKTGVELDVDELVGGGFDGLGAAATDDFGGRGSVAPDPSSESSSVPPSKTTKFAFDPSGTVTTQKFAPPAPSAEFCPSTSFTLWTAGSIAHGRPLQCPSHSILTPQVGILSRNGVAGSR